MKTKFITIAIGILNLSYCLTNGQTPFSGSNLNIVPPSPTAAALAKFAEVPVNLSTGAPQIGVPLYQAKSGSLSLPISLDYHASALKVEEVASWTGLKFSLSCGGVITRSVVGLPDDIAMGYFHNITQITGAPLTHVQYDDIINGNWDSEPDVFYFNFCGKSGRMIYLQNGTFVAAPAQDFKIEQTTLSNNNYIQSWVITTEDGTKYIFGTNNAIETTITSENSFISSWYLTQVVSADNVDQINLEYNHYSTNIVTSSAKVQNLSIPVGVNGGQQTNCSGQCIISGSNSAFLSSKATSTESTNIKLSKIICKNTEIDFSSSDRIDNADKKLDYISIIRNSIQISKINFSYSYFNSNQPGSLQRLKLDQVQICDVNGTNCQPPYVFNYYNPNSLPSLSSFAQDHWGFYNGVTSNQNMIPAYLIPPQITNVTGADREPTSDIITAETGILKSLTYPTGGTSEFIYELNDCVSNPISDRSEFVPCATTVASIYDADNVNHPGTLTVNDEVNFSIEHQQVVDIDVKYFFQLNSYVSFGGDNIMGSVNIINVSSGTSVWNDSWALNSGTQTPATFNLNLPVGNYILQTKIEDPDRTYRHVVSPNIMHTSVLANIKFETNVLVSANNIGQYCGGVRISKIIDHVQGGNANDMIRRFEYHTTLSSGSTQSSGHLVSLPQYKYINSVVNLYCNASAQSGALPGCSATTCVFLNLSSHSYASLGAVSGSNVLYSKVTVYNGDQGENGKTENTFTICAQNTMGVPFAPPANNDYKGGLLLSSIDYKNQGGIFIPVKRINNDYVFYDHSGDPNRKVALGLRVQSRQSGVYCGLPTFESTYYTVFYNVLSEWFYKSTSEEINYDESGQNPITITHHYFYENPTHMQLTHDEVDNSDGRIYKNYYKYPQDFNAITSSDPSTNALYQMSDVNHIHSVNIEKTSTIYDPVRNSEAVVGSVFTTYRKNGDIIRPYQTFELGLTQPLEPSTLVRPTVNNVGGYVYDSRYNLKSTIDKYDDFGNIIEMHNLNKPKTSFLWSYNASNPVAVFSNAGVNEQECSFIGFEPTAPATTLAIDEDNWRLSTSFYYSNDSHTGEHSLRIPIASSSPITGVSKDFVPSHQYDKYVFSSWAKTTSSFGNQNGNLVFEVWTVATQSNPATLITTENHLISQTGGEWKYVEVSADLNKIRTDFSIAPNKTLRLICYIKNSDPSNYLFVDDLRLNPYVSTAETFTYDPLFLQISSRSNNNSFPSYFDYDNFGRLNYVLDQNHKVLSRNDYHFIDTQDPNDLNSTTEYKLLSEYSKSSVAGTNIDANVTFENKTVERKYLDGIGRPIQVVNQQYTDNSQGYDLIQPIEYDQFGRNSIKYLPFIDYSNDGSFKANWSNDQPNFYHNSTVVAASEYPFATILYDQSSLNREVEEGSAGEDWQIGNNHTKKVFYNANSGDGILNWVIDLSGSSINGASASHAYPDGVLYKTEKNDENGNQTFEYKDKSGHVICTQSKVYSQTNPTIPETYDFTHGQQQNSCSDPNECNGLQDVFYNTYYVYNDLGQLSFVIPPGAIAAMNATSQNSFTLTSQIFLDYIYGYIYDSQGRVIEKKIPGKDGWNLTVYNSNDQVVFTQSPTESDENDWEFTKYDALGRVIMTGKYKTTDARSDLQNQVNQNSNLWEARTDVTSNGYTSNSMPLSQNEIYTLNYYDDYDLNFDSDFNGHAYQTFGTNVQSYRTRGMLTASKVKVLGTSDYLSTLKYYDDKGRIIQEHAKNYVGGWDVINNEFDFINRTTLSNRAHTAFYNPPVIINSRFNYDHSGRLTDIFKKVGNDPEILMVHNAYNLIGQLKSKNLHLDYAYSTEGYLQIIDYRYNIRGWLTNINNAALINDNGVTNSDDIDAFGEEIYYNNGTEVGVDNSASNTFYAINQYNGNISAIRWKVRPPEVDPALVRERAYLYRYDNLNRMTAGYYGTNTPGVSNWYNVNLHEFDESLHYDMMGNITHLYRNAQPGTVDDLNYSYYNNANQLQAVTDNISTNFNTGFSDGTNQLNEYLYDKNGNLTSDLNKNLFTTYNYLNLPSQVSDGNNSNIDILYDANGRKLRKTCNGVRHDYSDGIEYEDQHLKFISTEEGRIRPTDSRSNVTTLYTYDYFLKDHLGNIRAVITQEKTNALYAATMEDQNSYSEESTFENIPETREVKPINYPQDNTYSPNDKVSKLNASDGKTIGHAKVLEVKAGEELNFDTKYYYSSSPFVPDGSVTAQDILTQLANVMILNPPNSVAGVPLEKRQDWAQQTFTNNTGVSDFITKLLNNSSSSDPDSRKAYLVWLMFDKKFNFLSDYSGAQQAINPDQLGNLSVTNMKVPEEGYLYIYVSNESSRDVNFDNLQIHLKSSYLIEEDHYYPFGLLIDDISRSSGGTAQNYKYNGKELQHELSWNVEDYGARMYDPQICRFTTIDPLAAKARRISPYAYCYNDPIRYIDPDGMEGIVVSGQSGDHKNRTHFLENGLDRAKAMTKQFKKDGNGEKATWFIYNDGGKGGYTAKELAIYLKQAAKAGVNVQVVSDTKTITGYVNNKNGGDSRANDQVSNFSYLGHATPGDLDIGFVDHGLWNMATDKTLNISDFKSSAFAKDAKVDLVGGCRTAVPGDLPFERSVINQFAEILSPAATIKGSSTRVNYYDGAVDTDQQLVEREGGKIVTIHGENKDE